MNNWVRDHPYASRQEKDEAFKTFVSDPETCPLKMRHPINGLEFGIGCTMCADRSEEEKKKDKEEKEKRMRKNARGG